VRRLNREALNKTASRTIFNTSKTIPFNRTAANTELLRHDRGAGSKILIGQCSLASGISETSEALERTQQNWSARRGRGESGYQVRTVHPVCTGGAAEEVEEVVEVVVELVVTDVIVAVVVVVLAVVVVLEVGVLPAFCTTNTRFPAPHFKPVFPAQFILHSFVPTSWPVEGEAAVVMELEQ
jgi:hypothetical protein